MDDFQFWLYIAFAAIYFFSRMMKKKAPEEQSEENADPQSQPRRKPVSFEDLLKEIQEQHQPKAERQVVVAEAKPAPVRQQKKQPREEAPKDGVRQFADAESRKVYEDSIRMAEGYDIAFERDDHFKSRVLRKTEEADNSVGVEVLESLRNPTSARKAVILGEILNRKY